MTLTAAYLDYGGAHQIKFDKAEVTRVKRGTRWVQGYKASTDNATYQCMGKADREFTFKGGPITYTDLGNLDTLTTGTATVKFRSEMTGNADINVILIDYEAVWSSKTFGSLATADYMVEIKMKESV